MTRRDNRVCVVTACVIISFRERKCGQAVCFDFNAAAVFEKKCLYVCIHTCVYERLTNKRGCCVVAA